MAQCDKVKIAREFLLKTNWPMDLVDDGFSRCYCQNCYQPDYRDTYTVGGRVYVIPRDYTRIGLKVDDTYANHLNMWHDWVNCFHGTSIYAAKSIVEHRMLLLPGEHTLSGETIKIRPGHLEGQQFFFTTPTIKYAGLPNYASCYEFTSTTDESIYNITVVLQCKQKPDSFDVQPETVGAGLSRICAYIDNKEIEWKTQQRASITPYGLLLRVDKVKNRLDGIRRRCSTLGRTTIPDGQLDWMQVECPHCYHTQDWFDPKPNRGETLACEACKHKFTSIMCLYCNDSCFTFSNIYGRSVLVVYKCRNTKCNKGIMISKCFGCAHYNFIKTCDNKHQTISVSCANVLCKKKTYRVCTCVHCGEMKQRDDLAGRSEIVVKCSSPLCLRQYQLVTCPACSNVNAFPNAFAKVGRDDMVTCAYDGCAAQFRQPLQQRKKKQPISSAALPKVDAPNFESIGSMNAVKLPTKVSRNKLNQTM